MSALPAKADREQTCRHVRYKLPNALEQKPALFDHLVGAHLEFTADRKPERLRSLEIDERGQVCPIAIAGIVAASSALMNICYGGRVMAMKIDRIQPAGMNVRIQQGKPAYSHVVTVTDPGKTIYIAGQLARDAEGNIVGPGDMRAQLEQTFKDLDACLKAAGATWADVVKTNTFVTNYQAFAQCSDVRM